MFARHIRHFALYLLTAAFLMPSLEAFAQDAETDETVAAPDKIATLIFGIKARRNVDPALALVINEVIQGVYQTDPTRKVFGRSEIEQLLEFESSKQLMGCEDESCLIELASAMNVERIVSGTVDKVGSAYFVVINEMNTNEVQNVARVQARLPLDEDKFFEGLERMANELLQKSLGSRTAQPDQSALVKKSVQQEANAVIAPPPSASTVPGYVSITSDVPVEVISNQASMGITPLKLEATKTGPLTFVIKQKNQPPLKVTAMVESGQTTLVELRSNVTPEPSQQQIDDYDSDVFWSRLKSCGILGCGLAQCSSIFGVTYASLLIGSALAAESGAIWFIYSCGIIGFCVPSMCTAATLGYGCYRLFWGGPEHPSTQMKPVTRVIVTPPGKGADILHYDYDLTSLNSPQGGVLRYRLTGLHPSLDGPASAQGMRF